MSKHRYIEESDETPIFRKSAQFRSLSERIVDEFLFFREKKKDVKRVKVKIPPEKDPKAMARGLGKILKKKAPEFTSRLDTSGNIWIIER